MTTTIRATGDEAKSAQKFLDAQIDVENLAGRSAVDARVIKYAQDAVREHCEKVTALHQRWSITNHMLAGNTIDRAGPVDVHIPELYKMIETMVPRIEEVVIEQHDPWFRVKPRGESNVQKANSVAALYDYQLAQMQHRRGVQPGLRDMLVHQVVVEKIWWESRTELRPERRVEVAMDGLRPKYTINRPLKERLVYSGPKAKLVDPFDFVIDPKAHDAQDARFVGDRCYLSYYQLMALQEMGFLQNVEKLKDKRAHGSLFTPEIDYYKWSRSPIEQTSSDRTFYGQELAGQPGMFEVVELWGRYDLHGNGEHVEAVLTIANGDTVLRASENPNDYKHRPYAIGRVARNAHDFWGTGPLDNAVRLNQQLDRMNSIFLRAAEIAGCPMVFVEDDSELPDSLWKMRPFSIMKAVGKVTMTDVPDGMLQYAPVVLSYLTRQIEETVGVYKIEMGQQMNSGTATEASLSLAEGNRRMRGLVRAYTDMLDQKLKIMHWLNCQFLTDRVAFRVIGKRAKELGEDYLYFGPDSLLEDVDFEFVGITQLPTYGMRASALTQILTTAGPLIVQNPNRIDTVGIIHTLFETLVGQNEADRYVKPMPDSESRMAQQEENILLAQGVRIQVSPDDPHEMHEQEMRELFDAATQGKFEPQTAKVVIEHYVGHQSAMARQREADAVREREAQQRRTLLAPEAGGLQDEEGGQPPPAGGIEADQMGLEQVGGQRQGENPGPQDPNKNGRAMRPSNQSRSQSESQPRR